jgi:probable phosphoglycerate mutase
MYLTLHGQTEWNVERRVQGHRDSPLTELGRQQAVNVGRVLRGQRVDGIVSSPLGRTMETARIIATELGLDTRTIVEEGLLKEVSLGQWEGFTHAEVEARWPNQLAGSSRHDWYFRSPDGESHAVVAARLGAWLSANALREHLVIVTHGIASRVLRGLYRGLAAGEALQLTIARDAVLHLHNGRETPVSETITQPRTP